MSSVKQLARVASMIMVLMMALSGCSTRYVNQGSGEQASDYNLAPQVLYQVHEAFSEPAPPRCVVILPLQGVIEPRRRDLLRRAFYAHLSPRGFRDIEIPRVDHVVEENGLDLSREEDRVALAQLLHCDAWIGGEARSGSSFYGVYSEMEASAKLKMVRASDGALLWEAEHQAALKDGGLPFSPIGIAAGLFDAARNLEEEQGLRVIDDLARRMMSTIPDVQIAFSDDESVGELLAATDNPWEGSLDQWLGQIPQQDREGRLRHLLKNRSMTALQQEELYRRLTEISGKGRDYRLWGESRSHRGDYEGALEIYDQATVDQPGDAESWFLKGRMLTRLDRLEAADQSFIKAVAHNPDRDDYYAALGYLNSVRGDHARARAAYEMALQKNPENGFAWYNLAVTDYNDGHLRSATDSFHNAGQFYLRQGRLDRVEQVLSDLKGIQQESTSRSITEAIESLKSEMKQQINQ